MFRRQGAPGRRELDCVRPRRAQRGVGLAALADLRLTLQDRQTLRETAGDRRRGQGAVRGVAVEGGVDVGAILYPRHIHLEHISLSAIRKHLDCLLGKRGIEDEVPVG